MKPFDLEKALAGEPVKLRSGDKAYVKYVMPNEYKGEFPLRGIYIDILSNVNITEVMWTMDGFLSAGPQYDIIGMWEEPRPRVQLDLPAPLKEPQEGMWYITYGEPHKSHYAKETHNSWLISSNKHDLEVGYYFATKEDAEEWINAMKGARR